MSHSQTQNPSSRRHPLRLAVRGLLPLVAGLVLAGCTAPRPGADLPAFGDTLRHTRSIQTYQPGDEVPPLQGGKAVEVMQGYRQPTGAQQAPTSSMP
jgi:hypothetical protein